MYRFHFLAALFFCVYMHNVGAAPTTSPYPVLIIPGLSASALENIETGGRVWVEVKDLPPVSHKYEQVLATYWDPTDKKIYSNQTIEPYCGLEGVNAISGDPLDPKFREFEDFVHHVRSKSGGIDAAPYDWRLMPQPDQLHAWYRKTVAQVEDLYNTYRGTKVVLVAHSMGNLMTNFLLHQNETWNTHYIQAYAAVSPPWGGAGLGLQAVVTGIDIFHFGPVNLNISQSLLENFACFPWVFPQEKIWHTDTVIDFNGNNFTSLDIESFFTFYSSNSPVLPIMDEITLAYNYPLYFYTAPNVPVYLITSSLRRTAIGIKHVGGVWSELLEPEGPNFGDGTVPYKSLHGNDEWNYEASYHVPGSVSHSDIIKSKDFFAYIDGIVEAMPEPGTA